MKRNILLNPGPATTSDRVKQAQVVPDICPREREFGELLDRVRNKVLDVAKANDDFTTILIGGSGTAAVEACISSVLPADGKMLIIANGAYGDRMHEMCKIHYQSTQYVFYSSAPTQIPDLYELKTLLESSPEITHIAVVHHETTTGILNPLDAIYALAKEYNKVLIVDAMSSFAGSVIDLKATPCDFLIASSNKNLHGMAGIGLVIAKKSTLESIKYIPAKTLYLNLYKQYRCLQDTHQMQFTPPVQTLYALEAALDETLEETVEKRIARYHRNWTVLTDGMQALGFSLALSDDQPQSKILTTYLEPDWPGFDFDAMHDFAYAKGFTIYPGKLDQLRCFRLANIGDLYEQDMRDFLSVLAEYVDSIKTTP